MSGLALRRLPTLAQIQAEKARRSTRDAVRSDRESVRERCRSLAGFVREAWHVLEPGTPYIHGWHIDAICLHLEAITKGEFLARGLPNRLLINVPPGMAKSLLVSVFWPAWEWGPAGLPHARYLTTSYSEDYAKRDARKMRDLINSDWYQSLWGSQVQLVREAEMSFANTASGNREAMPFKSLTGGRGDRVILDDPHSTEQAESEADRRRAIRIFRESLPTRVNDPATSAIVIIMQRLHEEDVSGVALNLGLGYIHLMLPMEFEEDRACVTPIFKDPRTYEGELLFPERFPRNAVERLKIPLGGYGVAGQLQQRPNPRGGLLFQKSWFQIKDAAPAGLRRVRGWDLAASTSSSSPFTAGVRMGRAADGSYWIDDVVRERVENAEPVIVATASQDGTDIDISIPKDPGQAGKVQAKAIVAALAGYRVRATPESGEKEDRARPLAAQAEAGNVYLVRGPWNEAFLDELAAFPRGKFKDQVDAASRAFGHLVGGPAEPQMVVPVLVTGRYVDPSAHPEVVVPIV